MALVVEDGTGKANADSYGSVANVDAYWRDMGYVGTWQDPDLTVILESNATPNSTEMTIEGGAGAETALAGDRFQVEDISGFFTVTEDSRAVAGIGIVKYTPANASNMMKGKAVTFFGATEAQCRRGTRTLDGHFGPLLEGARSSSGQALQWPRIDVIDEDGNVVGSNVIPTRWKHAFYEMCRIVPADQSFDSATWIKSVRAGSAGVDFQGGIRARQVLDYVFELIWPYRSHGGGARILRA